MGKASWTLAVGLTLAVLADAVVATSVGLAVRTPSEADLVQTASGLEVLVSNVAISHEWEERASAWEPPAQVHLHADNGDLLLRCRERLVPVVNASSFKTLSTWGSGVTFAGRIEHVNAALSCLFYRSQVEFSGTDAVTLEVDFAGERSEAAIPIEVAPADSQTRPVLALKISRLHSGITEDDEVAFPLGASLEARVTDPLRAPLAIQAHSANGATLGFAGLAESALSATQAEDALRALTYLPARDFHGEDIVQIRVINEDSGAYTLQHVAVNVRSQNDAPELLVGRALADSSLEGLQVGAATALRFVRGQNASLRVIDVDAAPGEHFRVGLRAPPGSVRVARHKGVHLSTVTNTMGTADTETVLRGSLDALNEALANIVLTPSTAGELALWMWVEDGAGARSSLRKLLLSVRPAPARALFERPVEAPLFFDLIQGSALPLAALELVVQDSSDADTGGEDAVVVVQVSAEPSSAGTFDVETDAQLPYWVRREGLGTERVRLEGSVSLVSEAIGKLIFQVHQDWDSSTRQQAVELKFRAVADGEDVDASTFIVELFVLPRQDTPLLEPLFAAAPAQEVAIDGSPLAVPLRASLSARVDASAAKATLYVASTETPCGRLGIATEQAGLHIADETPTGGPLVIRGEADAIARGLAKLVFFPDAEIGSCDPSHLPQWVQVSAHLSQGALDSSAVTFTIGVRPASLTVGLAVGSHEARRLFSVEGDAQERLQLDSAVIRLESFPAHAMPPPAGSQRYTLWLQAKLGSFSLVEHIHADVSALFGDQGRSLVLKSVDLTKLRTMLTQVVYTPTVLESGQEMLSAELHLVESGQARSKLVSDAFIPIEIVSGDHGVSLAWSPRIGGQELVAMERNASLWYLVAPLQGLALQTRRSGASSLRLVLAPGSANVEAVAFDLVQDSRLGISLLPSGAVQGPLDELVLALEENLLRVRVALQVTQAPDQATFTLALSVIDARASATVDSGPGESSQADDSVLAGPFPLAFSRLRPPTKQEVAGPVDLLVDGFTAPFPNLLTHPLLASEDDVALGFQLPNFFVRSWSASEPVTVRMHVQHGRLQLQEGSEPTAALDGYETVTSINAWLAQPLRYFPQQGFEGRDTVSVVISGSNGQVLCTANIPIFVSNAARGVSSEQAPLADSARLEAAKGALTIRVGQNGQALAPQIALEANVLIVGGTSQAVYELEARACLGSVLFPQTRGLAVDGNDSRLRGQREKLNDALKMMAFVPAGADTAKASCDFEFVLRRPSSPNFSETLTLSLAVEPPRASRRADISAVGDHGASLHLGSFRRSPDSVSVLRVQEGDSFRISQLGWLYQFAADIAEAPIDLEISASQGELRVEGALDSSVHRTIEQSPDSIRVLQTARDVQDLLNRLTVQLPAQWNSEESGEACFVEITLSQSQGTTMALDEASSSPVQALLVPVHVLRTPQVATITGALEPAPGERMLTLAPLRLQGWSGFALGSAVDIELDLTSARLESEEGLQLTGLSTASSVHAIFEQLVIAPTTDASDTVIFRLRILAHGSETIVCERNFRVTLADATKSARLVSGARALRAREDEASTLSGIAFEHAHFAQEACELRATVGHGVLTIAHAASTQLRCPVSESAAVVCHGTPETLAALVATGLHYQPAPNYSGMDSVLLTVKLLSAAEDDLLAQVSAPILVEAADDLVELSIPPIPDAAIEASLAHVFGTRHAHEPRVPVSIVLVDIDTPPESIRVHLRSDGAIPGSWRVSHPAFAALEVAALASEENNVSSQTLRLQGSFRKVQRALQHFVEFSLAMPADAYAVPQSTELIAEAWTVEGDPGENAPAASSRQVLHVPLLSDREYLHAAGSGCTVEFAVGCQGLSFQRAALSETGLTLGWRQTWLSPPVTRQTAVVSLAVTSGARFWVDAPSEYTEEVVWTLAPDAAVLNVTAASLDAAQAWLYASAEIGIAAPRDAEESRLATGVSSRSAPPSLTVSARLQAEVSTKPSSATCMLPSPRVAYDRDFLVEIENTLMTLSPEQMQAVVPSITVMPSFPSVGASAVFAFNAIEARIWLVGEDSLRVSVHPAVGVRLGLAVNQSDSREVSLRASSFGALSEGLSNVVVHRDGSTPWQGSAALDLRVGEEEFLGLVNIRVEASAPSFWQVNNSFQLGLLHPPVAASHGRMAVTWQADSWISFDGLQIGSALLSEAPGLRSIRIEASNGHGLWLEDPNATLTANVVPQGESGDKNTLIILEPSGASEDSVQESQVISTLCDDVYEVHQISVADTTSSDPVSGSFRVSWKGHTSADIPHDASEVAFQAAIEAVTDIHPVSVTRTFNADSLASESYTWMITFEGLTTGPSAEEFVIEDSTFDSASTLVEIERSQVANAIGGAFRLRFMNQWTPLLAWDLDAKELEGALKRLAPSLFADALEVSLESEGKWGTRSFRVDLRLAGQFPLIEPDSTMLTGSGASITVSRDIPGAEASWALLRFHRDGLVSRVVSSRSARPEVLRALHDVGVSLHEHAGHVIVGAHPNGIAGDGFLWTLPATSALGLHVEASLATGTLWTAVTTQQLTLQGRSDAAVNELLAAMRMYPNAARVPGRARVSFTVEEAVNADLRLASGDLLVDIFPPDAQAAANKRLVTGTTLCTLDAEMDEISAQVSGITREAGNLFGQAAVALSCAPQDAQLEMRLAAGEIGQFMLSSEVRVATVEGVQAVQVEAASASGDFVGSGSRELVVQGSSAALQETLEKVAYVLRAKEDMDIAGARPQVTLLELSRSYRYARPDPSLYVLNTESSAGTVSGGFILRVGVDHVDAQGRVTGQASDVTTVIDAQAPAETVKSALSDCAAWPEGEGLLVKRSSESNAQLTWTWEITVVHTAAAQARVTSISLESATLTSSDAATSPSASMRSLSGPFVAGGDSNVQVRCLNGTVSFPVGASPQDVQAAFEGSLSVLVTSGPSGGRASFRIQSALLGGALPRLACTSDDPAVLIQEKVLDAGKALFSDEVVMSLRDPRHDVELLSRVVNVRGAASLSQITDRILDLQSPSKIFRASAGGRDVQLEQFELAAVTHGQALAYPVTCSVSALHGSPYFVLEDGTVQETVSARQVAALQHALKDGVWYAPPASGSMVDAVYIRCAFDWPSHFGEVERREASVQVVVVGTDPLPARVEAPATLSLERGGIWAFQDGLRLDFKSDAEASVQIKLVAQVGSFVGAERSRAETGVVDLGRVRMLASPDQKSVQLGGLASDVASVLADMSYFASSEEGPGGDEDVIEVLVDDSLQALVAVTISSWRSNLVTAQCSRLQGCVISLSEDSTVRLADMAGVRVGASAVAQCAADKVYFQATAIRGFLFAGHRAVTPSTSAGLEPLEWSTPRDLQMLGAELSELHYSSAEDWNGHDLVSITYSCGDNRARVDLHIHVQPVDDAVLIESTRPEPLNVRAGTFHRIGDAFSILDPDEQATPGVLADVAKCTPVLLHLETGLGVLRARSLHGVAIDTGDPLQGTDGPLALRGCASKLNRVLQDLEYLRPRGRVSAAHGLSDTLTARVRRADDNEGSEATASVEMALETSIADALPMLSRKLASGELASTPVRMLLGSDAGLDHHISVEKPLLTDAEAGPGAIVTIETQFGGLLVDPSLEENLSDARLVFRTTQRAVIQVEPAASTFERVLSSVRYIAVASAATSQSPMRLLPGQVKHDRVTVTVAPIIAQEAAGSATSTLRVPLQISVPADAVLPGIRILPDEEGALRLGAARALAIEVSSSAERSVNADDELVEMLLATETPGSFELATDLCFHVHCEVAQHGREVRISGLLRLVLDTLAAGRGTLKLRAPFLFEDGLDQLLVTASLMRTGSPPQLAAISVPITALHATCVLDDVDLGVFAPLQHASHRAGVGMYLRDRIEGRESREVVRLALQVVAGAGTLDLPERIPEHAEAQRLEPGWITVRGLIADVDEVLRAIQVRSGPSTSNDDILRFAELRAEVSATSCDSRVLATKTLFRFPGDEEVVSGVEPFRASLLHAPGPEDDLTAGASVALAQRVSLLGPSTSVRTEQTRELRLESDVGTLSMEGRCSNAVHIAPDNGERALRLTSHRPQDLVHCFGRVKYTASYGKTAHVATVQGYADGAVNPLFELSLAVRAAEASWSVATASQGRRLELSSPLTDGRVDVAAFFGGILLHNGLGELSTQDSVTIEFGTARADASMLWRQSDDTGVAVRATETATGGLRLQGTQEQVGRALELHAGIVYVAPESPWCGKDRIRVSVDGQIAETFEVNVECQGPEHGLAWKRSSVEIVQGQEDSALDLGSAGLEIADLAAQTQGCDSEAWMTQVVVTSSNGGSFSLARSIPGVFALFDSTATLVGCFTEVNEAIANLRYTPEPEFFGSVLLQWTLSRPSRPAMDAAEVTLEVAAVNDGPRISHVPPSHALIVGETESLVLGSLVVRDVDIAPDSPEAYEVTLLVPSGRIHMDDPGERNLLIAREGNGRVTLRGLLAEVNLALRDIIYTAPARFAGEVRVEASARDGQGRASSVEIAITVPSSDAKLSIRRVDERLEAKSGSALLGLVAAPGRSIGLNNVLSLEEHAGQTTFGRLGISAVPAGAQPEVQHVLVRRPTFLDVQVVRLRATQDEVAAPASFVLLYAGESTLSIDRAALDAASKEIGASLGTSVESRLAMLSSVDRVEVSRTKFEDFGLEWAVTFFRTTPGPLLALASETDPQNAIEVEVERVLGADEVSLSGSFSLQLGGRVTEALEFDAPAIQVQRALQDLPNVNLVHVTEESVLYAADAEVAAAWGVTFVRPSGDVPLLKALVLNSTAKAARVEVLEHTKGYGTASVQRVVTSAVHRNQVVVLRSTAATGPVEGAFTLALDLSALGGSRAVSGLVDHAAVATMAEERVHASRGSRPGDSIESVVNHLLEEASTGMENHLREFRPSSMYVTVSRSDEICDHACHTYQGDYPTPLCSFDAACDVCIRHCSAGEDQRCFEDAHCQASCTPASADRQGECLSSGAACVSDEDCQSSGICNESGCRANVVGAYTWRIEFHNAPSALPLLEVASSELAAPDAPDIFVDVLQARRDSPVPQVSANEISGALVLDGVAFPHAPETDFSLPRVMALSSLPDLEGGLVLHLVDLGRAEEGLPFPISVDGAQLAGAQVHVETAKKFLTSQLAKEQPLWLDLGATTASLAERDAPNELRLQGTLQELNGVLSQEVRGLRLSGQGTWFGRAIVRFEASALASDAEAVVESFLVDIAPAAPQLRLQLESTVRAMREDLDVLVFGPEDSQIAFTLRGEADLPLVLAARVSSGFLWIEPTYRLVHRSVAYAGAAPSWAERHTHSSISFAGSLAEIRDALSHLMYRGSALGVAELSVHLSVDSSRYLLSQAEDLAAVARTIWLHVRPLETPLLFADGATHRVLSIQEGQSVALLEGVQVTDRAGNLSKETVEATLEVQRGKLSLALADDWPGQDEMALSADRRTLRVRSTREGLNAQILGNVQYHAPRDYFVGEDMGILTVESPITRRATSMTLQISIHGVDHALDVAAQSPTAPLEIDEDSLLPLEGVFHITDFDAPSSDELSGENITLELVTEAAHVDMQQAIRTGADSGTLAGYFRVSLDLGPWGGILAESDRIAFDAVPSLADERTTHAVGTGRGESMEAKLNAMLADAAANSTLPGPITVSVSLSLQECVYACQGVPAAYDPAGVLCSQDSHCDVCVGMCGAGSAQRCVTDAECDNGAPCSFEAQGECLSDGSACDAHEDCTTSGICTASSCADSTVGGRTWTVTFHDAPWDLPMLQIAETNLHGAVNAQVACDVIMDRSPALPVRASNHLGGSFHINGHQLAYNASAFEVEAILRTIVKDALVRNATLHGPRAAPVPVGGTFVEVLSRAGPSLEGGFRWTLRMSAAAQRVASGLIVDRAALQGSSPRASLRFVAENGPVPSSAWIRVSAAHGRVGVLLQGYEGAAPALTVQLADAAAIEPYLSHLAFFPEPNWNSEAGRAFAAVRVEAGKVDLDDSGRMATQFIHVTAVNDGPVLSLPGQILDAGRLTSDQLSGKLQSAVPYEVREGTASRVTGISVRDVDAGTSSVRIDLDGTNGTLSLANEVALESLQQSSPSSMTMIGAVEAVNYALEHLVFSSDNMFGEGGSGSLAITVSDLGHSGKGAAGAASQILQDHVVLPLSVSANDDAPRFHFPADCHAWVCREDDGLLISSVSVDFVNFPPDEPIQVEARAEYGSLHVPVIFADVNATVGFERTLLLEGPVAAVNRALAELVYSPLSDFDSAQVKRPDSIRFEMRSVRGHEAQALASVYVEPVNDPPFIVVPEATVEYNGKGVYRTVATPVLHTPEDVPLVLPTLSIQDADGDLDVVQVMFSCSYCSLRVASTGAAASVEVSNAAVSDLRVSGQLGRVNAALGAHLGGGIIYTPARDWSGSDSVVVSVQDAAGSTDLVSLTIVVEPVNDAPVWQLPDPATLRVDEDGALALSTVRVADVDAADDDYIMIEVDAVHGKVAVNYEAPSAKITVNNTVALVNQALSSLMFYPAAHAHALDDELEAEAIHFVANDQGNSGAGGAQTAASELPIVNIVPWTDPPRLEVPGAVYANASTCQESKRISWPRRVEDVSLYDICGAIVDVAPIEALEDDDLEVTGVRVQDSDTSVSLNPRRLRIEMSVTSGRIFVTPRGAASFTTRSDGRHVELYGSPAECNAVLSLIVYRPDLHFYGQDHLVIVAEDSGQRASGVQGATALRDEQRIPLHILPVQDVPQFVGDLVQTPGGPALLSTSEDLPLFLAGPHRTLSVAHPDGDAFEIAFVGMARHGTMSLDPDDFVEVKYLADLTQAAGAAAKEQVRVLAFSGSVATIREAIEHIIYVPEEDWSGVEDITMVTMNLGDLDTNYSRVGDDFLSLFSARIAEATGSLGIEIVGDRFSSAVVNIMVSAVNDVPTIRARSGMHSGEWTCAEDGEVFLTGLEVGDVDQDALTVTLRASHGVVDVYALDVASRELFVDVTRSSLALTLVGPADDLNTLFAEDLLFYRPTTDWNGVDEIEILVADADGAAVSLVGRVIVSAVNDAPEIAATRRPGAASVFTVAEGGRTHLSGPVRLQPTGDDDGESVREHLEQPAAGIWRSLVVRPSRTLDTDPSWRYSLASNASEPEQMTVLGGSMIVFSAKDDAHGRELWRFGGSASTTLIKDLWPGTSSSKIDSLHLHDDGLVYFAAEGKDWTWTLTTDACGGFYEASAGLWLAVSQSTSFDRFGSYDCPLGYHWASTAELAAVVGPATERAAARSGQMRSYYASLCGWSFDEWEGAVRHRFMLADSAKTGVYLDSRQEAGSPGQLAPEVLAGGALDESQFAGLVCMANAADGSPCPRSQGCFRDAGRELWATDGTAEGTRRVVDVFPGADGSHPSDLATFDGDVFFAAWSEMYGRELWRSDGTAAGTRMVQDLWSGIESSNPKDLTVAGSLLFFTAEDEWHGVELWVSDGVSGFTGARPTVTRVSAADDAGAGTHMVLDIRAGDQIGSEPSDLLALVDDYVAFVASDGIHGRQIWVSDGSALGTGRITAVRSDRSELGCDPRDLVLYNQQLYFTAVDGEHGRELWRVGGVDESWSVERPDGSVFQIGGGSSPEAAALVADLLPGSASSSPGHLHVFTPVDALDVGLRGTPLLVFEAMDALWKLNSAEVNAVPQRTFETTAADLRFTEGTFVDLGGTLYFGARPARDDLYHRAGSGSRSSRQPFHLADVDAARDEVYTLTIVADLGSVVFEDGAAAANGVTGTLEELNTLLRRVYFEATPGRNGAGVLIVTLTDAEGASTVETFDIVVTPVNSPPAISLSATTVRVSRSGPKVVPLHVEVNLQDELETPEAILEVVLRSDVGRIRVDPREGVTLVARGERDVVLHAPKASLGEVLSQMRYALDETTATASTAAVSITVRDLGGSGAGDPLDTVAQIEIVFTE